AISGYGQDGPYRDRVGHDVNYLAQAGVLGYVGAAGGPPVVSRGQIADIRGGAVMGLLGVPSPPIAPPPTEPGPVGAPPRAARRRGLLERLSSAPAYARRAPPGPWHGAAHGRVRLLQRLRDPRWALAHDRRLRAALLGHALPRRRARGSDPASMGGGRAAGH